MGKKVFDFRQHTMFMGVPRMTPIITLASSVDERSAVNQLKSNWDMNTVVYICKQIVNNYGT